jgi:hypothetical protein
LLVAFGVLTVIIGLMTLLAGSLRDLTRTRRRAFGIGGLLLVFLGCAAAVGNLDDVITLDSRARTAWFAVVGALYAGAVLTAVVLTFVVSSTGRANPDDRPAEEEVTTGQPEQARAGWRGHRRQPAGLAAGAQRPLDADGSDEGPGKPASGQGTSGQGTSGQGTSGQSRKAQRQSSPVG